MSQYNGFLDMRKQFRRKAFITALEPRILLDGAAVATVIAATTDAEVQDAADATDTSDTDVTAVATTESQRKDVAIVDSQIDDYETMVSELEESGYTVYVIDGDSDGLTQILEALANEDDIDGLHIYSHGSEASIELGSTTLDSDSLSDYTELLEELGEHLSTDGDILLYGCNTGDSDEGQAFIDALAEITDADVAASDDITGAESEDGDWELEVTSGTVDSDAIAVDSYAGTLEAESGVTYTEGDGTVTVTGTVTFAESEYYGGYIEFSVEDASSTESIGLVTSDTASTEDGVVSIVGTTVYLGDGTTATMIGEVDSTYNGEDGTALRINLYSGFENGTFDSYTVTTEEDGSTTTEITGWTVVDSQIVMGTTEIAGYTTPTDSTGATDNVTVIADYYSDDDLTVEVTSSGDNNVATLDTGTQRLESDYAGDVIRGPAIYSDSSVILSEGDTVSFDWQALAGGDAYDAYGYLLCISGENAGTTITILDETGENLSEDTAWTTSSITISADQAGEYIFVFVAGSWDQTAGCKVGGSLNIDNVTVTYATPPVSITSSTLASISDLVTYTNDAEDVASDETTRTITVTTSDSDGDITTDTLNTVEFVNENDAPEWSDSSTALATTEVNVVSSGETVADIFGSLFTDTDNEYASVDSLAGIIVSVDGSDSSEGEWEYSTDGGTTWYSISDASVSESSALVLSADTLLRFNASEDYSGTPGALTVSAVDSSSALTYTDGSTLSTYDLMAEGATGGSSAVSANTVDLTATIVIPYTENSSAVTVTGTVTFDAAEYTGEYIEFSIDDSTSTETLGFITSDTASTEDGVVSIVDGLVYVGNGTTAQLFGYVDTTYNGENGSTLRIYFTNEFTNGSFEEDSSGSTTVTGWTIVDEQIVLGETVIAGYTTPTDTVYPSGISTDYDDVTPITTFERTYTITSDSEDEENSTNVLTLSTGEGTISLGSGVIRGPAVYSNTVTLNAGDTVSFDWQALAGGDAYDAYGYLLNINTGETITILNETGADLSSDSAWTTSSITITEEQAGAYIFVFVAGSYDETGGRVVGGSLNIDNVTITYATDPVTVDGDLLASITDLVTYSNSADDVDADETLRTITVTTVDSDGTETDETLAIVEFENINDAPELSGDATLTSVDEDTSSTGQTVADIFSSLFDDADSEFASTDSLAGVIVSVDSSDSSDGEWQYSTDGGTTWYSIGEVSADTALVLSADTLLRFDASENYNGTPGALTVSAVDSTSTLSYTSGSTRETYDLTSEGATGGTTAVAATTAELSADITAVNDAPDIDGTFTGEVVIDPTDSSPTQSRNGSISVDDVDEGDTATAEVTDSEVVSVSSGVSLSDEDTATLLDGMSFSSFDADTGTITWTYEIDSETAIDILGYNHSATLSFTVTVSDGNGGTVSRVLTIDVVTESLPSVEIEIVDTPSDPEPGDDPTETDTSYGLILESPSSDDSSAYMPGSSGDGLSSAVDVSVNTNGEVYVDDLATKDVLSLSVSDIHTTDGGFDINVADTNPNSATTTYTAFMADGAPLPDWIVFDSNGAIIHIDNPPEGVTEVNIQIKAVDADGNVRLLNIKVDVQEAMTAGKEATQSAEEISYQPLDQQIDHIYAQKMDYGQSLFNELA